MESEALIRAAVFAGVFALLVLWEAGWSRRKRNVSRRVRWGGNLGITLLNTLLIRVVYPGAAAGFAAAVYGQNVGLFGLTEIPYWAQLVITVVWLDFVLYIQHVLFHTLPLLVSIHRMHHMDPELDVTSGLRFHPLEMLISTGIKMGAVLILGAPPLGVILFAVLLNAASMFNHANVYIHPSIDRVLRLLLVTPDMHRVHHSVIRNERNSNYGFAIPWWDRLFRTYRAQPKNGHLAMVLGHPAVQGRRAVGFLWMLLHPFLKISIPQQSESNRIQR